MNSLYELAPTPILRQFTAWLALGVLVTLEKEGHQYVWSYFEPKKDNTAKVIIPVPTAVYCEQIYDYSDFSFFGFGAPWWCVSLRAFCTCNTSVACDYENDTTGLLLWSPIYCFRKRHIAFRLRNFDCNTTAQSSKCCCRSNCVPCKLGNTCVYSY